MIKVDQDYYETIVGAEGQSNKRDEEKEMADKEEEMQKQMANELKEKDKQIQEMLQKLHQLSK
jgi:uncharacterized protein HemX